MSDEGICKLQTPARLARSVTGFMATRTREMLAKYLPRLFQAIDLEPDHYKVILKTGFDGSQHTMFCMRTGIKSKTASGNLSDAINVTIAGKN